MGRALNTHEYWPGYHKARTNVYSHGYEWARMVGKEIETTKPEDYMKGYRHYLKEFAKTCEYSTARLLELV